MNDTMGRVRALMVKEFQLNPATVLPETRLADLGVDSLSALEFVFALESEFSIRFESDVDLRGGEVRDIIEVVDAERSRHAAAAAAA